jgi:hypothetical protein
MICRLGTNFQRKSLAGPPPRGRPARIVADLFSAGRPRFPAGWITTGSRSQGNAAPVLVLDARIKMFVVSQGNPLAPWVCSRRCTWHHAGADRAPTMDPAFPPNGGRITGGRLPSDERMHPADPSPCQGPPIRMCWASPSHERPNRMRCRSIPGLASLRPEDTSSATKSTSS